MRRYCKKGSYEGGEQLALRNRKHLLNLAFYSLLLTTVIQVSKYLRINFCTHALCKKTTRFLEIIENHIYMRNDCPYFRNVRLKIMKLEILSARLDELELKTTEKSMKGSLQD